jgi:Domain of unknown function (DUF4190)
MLVEPLVSTFGRGDVSAPPSEDATLLFHPPVEAGRWAQPDVYTPPPQVWQPPPPPTYVKTPSQGLAIASMVTGILGLLFGILCFGPVIGIISVVLGFIALSQNKKTPQLVGGRPFAIVGIVTGGLALLLYGGMTIFFLVLSNL